MKFKDKESTAFEMQEVALREQDYLTKKLKKYDETFLKDYNGMMTSIQKILNDFNNQINK